LIYLALRNAEATWKKTPISWHQAKARFAQHFEQPFMLID